MDKQKLLDFIKKETDKAWEGVDSLFGRSDLDSLCKKTELEGILKAYRDVLDFISNPSVVRCSGVCNRIFTSKDEEYDFVAKNGTCVRCEDIEKDGEYDRSNPAERGDSAEDFI